MSHTFANEHDNRRYTMHVGSELVCVLDYAGSGDVVSFTRTFTAPAHRGRGYAAELVKYAVDDIEAKGEQRIVPMCWYVSDWFHAHPEREGLLATR